MTEETRMTAIDELFKEWLDVRFPKEEGFKLSKNLTYDKFNDEAHAEFGKWLLDRYSLNRKARKKENTAMTEEKNTTLLDYTDNESLNLLFIKWIVDGGYRLLGLGDTALARREFPSFQDLHADNKVEFANWLSERYIVKSQNSSEEKAIAILEQFGWCSDRELIPIDPRMRELIDRVRGYIDDGVFPENAVLCVVRDWANGDTFNSGLDKTLKRLVYKTIMELKLKENNK